MNLPGQGYELPPRRSYREAFTSELPPLKPTPELTGDGTERDAALAICARARGKADAILLLTMCGLLRLDGSNYTR